MPGFERAATIDRPPAQVHAVLDDVPNCGRWMPSVRKVEVLTPTQPVGVGYRWRETRRVLGIFRLRMELEINLHAKPTLWGLEYNDGKTRALASFKLEPAGAGTQVTLREDVTALDGNDRRVARMAKQVEKGDDDLLRRLKAYVESLPRLEEPVRASRPAKAKAGKRASKRAPKPKATGQPKPRAKTTRAKKAR